MEKTAMSTNTLTPTKSRVDISTIRRRLLRVHGTILFLVALAATINLAIAYLFGAGVYGFLQQNPLAWNGLLQAYLLMLIIAGLIWLGAGDVKARRWDVVGALAHLPPLIAVIFTWDAIQSAGVGTVAIASFAFHTIWIAIEIVAALSPEPVQSTTGLKLPQEEA